MKKKPEIFLVHKWEACNVHCVHMWDGVHDEPDTQYFDDWRWAFRKAYTQAKRLGLDYFQVDHPDFPHKFIKVMYKKMDG